MTSACPGCGLELPPHDGPTHPYIGASAACWALYGEVLAREYSSPEKFAGHRLSVDAYAVQHPGGDDPRAIRSVAVHLMALCLIFERGRSPEWVTARMSSVVKRAPASVRRLDPPVPNGTLMVADLLAAGDEPAAHLEAGRRWALDVWTAWSPHHDVVRGWIDQSFGDSG